MKKGISPDLDLCLHFVHSQHWTALPRMHFAVLHQACWVVESSPVLESGIIDESDEDW